MANNCRIYTPDTWVSILLDEVEYSSHLYGKRVLENSCGTGNVLLRIVERYIIDALSSGYSVDEIRNGLERDVTGLEIHSDSIKKCKQRLNNIAKKYGVTGVKWDIRRMDALSFDDCNYSFVIGNPPYITYHDLSIEERTKLRTNFCSCRKGRFDYCYAFIEKSISNLAQGGKLAYIVPNSILKNVWAEELRLYIQPYIRRVIDLKNRNVFEDVTLSPVILIAEKANRFSSDSIVYQCEEEYVEVTVSGERIVANMRSKHNGENKPQYRFGDCFVIANSIATLLNEAFLISDYTVVNQKYICTKGKMIERAILHPALSIKSLGKTLLPMIIFPYGYREDGELVHYNEEFMLQNFPYAMQYLQQFKGKLDKRAADKSAKWFEYGRSQALRHLKQKKLIMSIMVSEKVKLAIADENVIPYAGLYITPAGSFSLEQAKEILESDEFKEYAKQQGVPTVSQSYRISKSIVENFCFDLK